MSEPLRILHVFRAPVGGLFRHVMDVARGQIERGHHVGIFCDSLTGGTRAQDALGSIEAGLKLGLTRIPMRRNPHWSDVVALKTLRGLVRQHDPQILHGHGSKGGFYVRTIPVSSKPVRAYTPHGGSFNYNPGSFLHKIYMQVEKHLTPRTSVFLFESAYIYDRFDYYVGTTPAAVRVVFNGIAESEFEPIEAAEQQHDFVFVGELRFAKGVDVLIEALRRARQETGQDITALLVGGGPNEEALRKQALQAGLGEAITFLPPMNIRQALGKGKIMVVPSLAESLPYVVLEAAAARQPLLATNVGGIPEIFGPHAHRLIPPGDPEALKKALLAYLHESPAERATHAEALSQHVRSIFTIDGMIDGVMEGYEAGKILPI